MQKADITLFEKAPLDWMHRKAPGNLSSKVCAALVALFVLVGLSAAPVMAQHMVTGEVLDAEEGFSLPGVNIIVKGTQIGTATRSNGEFNLEVPSSDDILVVSFVGYVQIEVPIEGRSEIIIPLDRSVMSLDEVVVSVPYGTQTVATTTGSVSQISGAVLDEIPTTNLPSPCKGRLPA